MIEIIKNETAEDVHFVDPTVWKGVSESALLMKLILPSGRECSLWDDYPRAFELVYCMQKLVAGTAFHIKNSGYGPFNPERKNHAPVTIEQMEAELDRLEAQEVA
jgi:hypothetical protein